ncbi:hypothetical protein [Actinomadura gamaensis]|uniref:DUF5648 domain-containing protein n=1 Tax=Actinomadura gamaensis TaxID=1763541 RepID=A0ABV9TWL6_9ACTN
MRKMTVVAVAATATIGGAGLVAAPANASEITSAKASFGRLTEFRTPTGGLFYTASAKEAKLAVAKYKFRPTGAKLGYLSAKPFRGGLPLYRLRTNGKSANYLITMSAKERNKLVASHRFRYEGVLGYSSTKSATTRTLLLRVTNGKVWKLALKSQYPWLKKHGYKLDGPLGYVWYRA